MDKNSRHNLSTYGDLKKLLNRINRDKKLQTVYANGKDVAIGTLVGLIPGGSIAKSGYDVLKGLVQSPDTKKSNTWLDKLDMDDDMSKIVDDTVENGFVQALFKSIESKPDDQELEDDFDINDAMVDYLRKTYNNRTVSGVSEMKKSQLKSIVKELLNEKIKGVDGKACWKGYRYAGTKNGKDKCVPTGK